MVTIIILKSQLYLVCVSTLIQRLRNSSRAVCLALIPPFFLDCVLAIGVATPVLLPDGSPVLLPDHTVKREIRWTASGFLYGDFVEKTEKESRYRIFLVTNRHVINSVITNSAITNDTVYVRFNPEASGAAREFDINLKGTKDGPTWFGHPCPAVDLAIIPINPAFLKEQGIKFSYFTSDSHAMDRAKANEAEITEGNGIYVLGFPMGLVGEERNFVVVRQGSIARIRDFLAASTKEFLVDAFVFPGNSGGPVIIKPEISSIQGTKPLKAAYLIGMVKSYVPYQDIATSEQTKRPRIVFEENSSLASVVPVDFINEAIAEFKKPPAQRKSGC